MAKKKNAVWNWIDTIEGDKVVWLIVLTLIMFSIVSIFASTSLLAIEQHTTRTAIFKEQIFIVVFGLLLIAVIYWMSPRFMWIIRCFSQLGFVVSLGLLLCLVFRIGTVELNDAVRAISIGGFQLQVYEVVKVAMVMYLAWAIEIYTDRRKEFGIVRLLGDKPHFEWLKSRFWQRIIYIFCPMIMVVLCIMMGSLSSALFIGFIMFVTIMIGGIKFKDLIVPGVIAGMLLAGIVGLHYIAPDRILQRWDTWMERLFGDDHAAAISQLKPGTKEFNDAIDKIRQPEGAKMAIKQGGIIGKGPGKSTQKYVVAVMFGDYMFSFIVEEYGIIGALIIIILYVSLLARGSLIVRHCDTVFAQTAVAGLTILISGQAFMHMFINVDMGPLTGQTLPMISHGNTSFLCFSIAFGIILAISKTSTKRIEKLEEKAEPIIASKPENDVKDAIDDLEALDELDY